jgi:hypothetical protein
VGVVTPGPQSPRISTASPLPGWGRWLFRVYLESRNGSSRPEHSVKSTLLPRSTSQHSRLSDPQSLRPPRRRLRDASGRRAGCDSAGTMPRGCGRRSRCCFGSDARSTGRRRSAHGACDPRGGWLCRELPAAVAAPTPAILVPPSAVAEMKDNPAVQAPTLLAVPLVADDLDLMRELLPIDRVEEAVFRPNHHQRSRAGSGDHRSPYRKSDGLPAPSVVCTYGFLPVGSLGQYPLRRSDQSL